RSAYRTAAHTSSTRSSVSTRSASARTTTPPATGARTPSSSRAISRSRVPRKTRAPTERAQSPRGERELSWFAPARAARMNTAQGSVAPVQILAISDVYPPDLGEVAVSLRTLLREIQAKGYAVTLIAPECGANDDDRCDDVIRVSAHAVRLRARVARVMKVQRVLELTERLRGWNYDLVHVHTPGVAYSAGTALARRLRLPVVATCYALQEEALLRSFPVLRPAGARTVARLLARVYCRGL